MTVYRRPDPIPLPHARPVHGMARIEQAIKEPLPGQLRAPVSNLSEKFAADLALGLMAGRFLHEGVLWTEPQLCFAFGISRTALREAIKILSAKGIVETRRKRGTILRQRSEWNILDPDVIRWLLVAEPDRTMADLTEALNVLAQAADTQGRPSLATVDNAKVAAAIDRIEQIGNPFLSAFTETTRSALQERKVGASTKKETQHEVTGGASELAPE